MTKGSYDGVFNYPFCSSVEYRAEVSACGFVTREVLIACRSFLIFVSVCWSVLHKPHFDLVGMCSFQFVPIGELGLWLCE